MGITWKNTHMVNNESKGQQNNNEITAWLNTNTLPFTLPSVARDSV